MGFYKGWLLNWVKDCIQEGEFTLSSGIQSSYCVDLDLMVTQPDVLKYLAQELDDMLDDEIQCFCPDIFGGQATGADPLAIALSMRSKYNSWFSIRGNKIVGSVQGTVCLVEDVTSTGRSLAQAYNFVTAAGGKVEAAVAVLDRGDCTTQIMADLNVPYKSLFTYEDIQLPKINCGIQH